MVKTIIRDRQDAEYEIVIDDDGFLPQLRLKLLDSKVQETMVGSAKCWIDGETLLLEDLEIKEKVILVFRQRRWFFQPETREERCFRNLGLGTTLLSAVIEFAKRKGMKRIEGKIVKRDYDSNANLPNWYRNRGFEVNMETSPSNIVGKISKIL